MANVEQEVREATNRFYGALNQVLGAHDPRPMLDILSHDTQVSVMHPDGGRVEGWDQVRGTIEMWAHNVSDAKITPRELHIHPIGNDVAIATGWEEGGGRLGGERFAVSIRATVVFRREGTAWKVIHHHVDMSPEVRSLVQRLPAGAATRTT
jgi:ketosteroid isomerase-like protein